MSINKVVISGNLTRDPQLRATSSGTSVLAIGVAVNEYRRDSQTGETIERANFVDCTVFGRRADALAKILRKGMRVCVEGRLRYESWGQDGQRRSKLSVVVDEVVLMSAGQQGAGSQASQPDARAAVAEAYPGASVSAYEDDDIPF